MKPDNKGHCTRYFMERMKGKCMPIEQVHNRYNNYKDYGIVDRFEGFFEDKEVYQLLAEMDEKFVDKQILANYTKKVSCEGNCEDSEHHCRKCGTYICYGVCYPCLEKQISDLKKQLEEKDKKIKGGEGNA